MADETKEQITRRYIEAEAAEERELGRRQVEAETAGVQDVAMAFVHLVAFVITGALAVGLFVFLMQT
jgi:hypothetical protein